MQSRIPSFVVVALLCLPGAILLLHPTAGAAQPLPPAAPPPSPPPDLESGSLPGPDDASGDALPDATARTMDPPVADALPSVTAPPPASPAPAAPAETEYSVAGHQEGFFFIRSPDGNYVLMPSLRAQIDANFNVPSFEAPGQPRDTITLRRVRPELYGSLFGNRIDFLIAADVAAPIGGLPVTDAYAVIHPTDYFHITVGQFDVPFSLENRTSDRFLEALERSFAVRNLGTNNKEPGLMLTAGPTNHLFLASVGVFTGDGQNRRNLDNRFDLAARAFVRPFAAGSSRLLKGLQIGGSLAVGSRFQTNNALGERGGWLSTGTGYSFFRSVYTGADGNGTQVGVIPEGTVRRYGAEIRAPLGPFTLQAEIIHMQADTIESYFASGVPLRTGGRIEATGLYVMAQYWLFGDPELLPEPGLEEMRHLSRGPVSEPGPSFALQAVMRFDYAHTDYRAGTTINLNQLGPSQANGTYDYVGVIAGANLWWTRSVRLGLFYTLHHIDGLLAVIPAPGQLYTQEIDVRVALAL